MTFNVGQILKQILFKCIFFFSNIFPFVVIFLMLWCLVKFLTFILLSQCFPVVDAAVSSDVFRSGSGSGFKWWRFCCCKCTWLKVNCPIKPFFSFTLNPLSVSLSKSKPDDAARLHRWQWDQTTRYTHSLQKPETYTDTSKRLSLKLNLM